MRSRRWVVAALVLSLVAGACTSGHGGPQARPGITGTRAVAVKLAVTGADIVSPHQVTTALDDATRRSVLDVVQGILDATLVEPVTTGRAGSVDKLFTDAAAARAIGVDRAALFDEGLPSADSIVADKTDVGLRALAGGDDAPALVVARFDWDVSSSDRSWRVERTGELSLIPVFGRWLVAAYTVADLHTVNGCATTTTAVSK